MSKDEICTCKACKYTVFHCQICKFMGFLLPSSSWLLKLPIAETRSYIFRWRSRFPRRRVCLSSLMPTTCVIVCPQQSIATNYFDPPATRKRRVLTPEELEERRRKVDFIIKCKRSRSVIKELWNIAEATLKHRPRSVNKFCCKDTVGYGTNMTKIGDLLYIYMYASTVLRKMSIYYQWVEYVWLCFPESLKITFIWMQELKAILVFYSLINRFVSLNSMLYNLPPRGKRML